ncbi:tail protein X [Chromobacterium haemolyticum]|nr:tail protein X [Chromobacterium haemolyticum]
MAMTIRTCDGDMLDVLCRVHYGYDESAVEQVLEANPGLAAIREPYPSGVSITLPDIEAPAGDVVTLWE